MVLMNLDDLYILSNKTYLNDGVWLVYMYPLFYVHFLSKIARRAINRCHILGFISRWRDQRPWDGGRL